jgi:DNA-binding transcriptional ArsR family regulator
MLELELVQGKPALEIAFRVSLPADLLHVMALVMDADAYEGLDAWVYATHAGLPADLRGDMQVVLLLALTSHTPTEWILQLPPDTPAHHDFASLIAWLNGFGQDDYQRLTERALASLAEGCGEADSPRPAPQDDEALKACLCDKLDEEQRDRTLGLLRDPAEFKAQFISVLTRFWERFYREAYARCLPLMEHSISYHARQNYGPDLGSVFTAVTGRRLPQTHEGYDQMEQVVFVPSCHIGPYVTFDCSPSLPSVTLLHYNCRPSGTLAQDRGLRETATAAIQDMFPPLKALSDETRLQILSLLNGGELYAQEIVDQLEISQSAVSRHLRLMVTGGLLRVRQDGSNKYYSIDEDTLGALASQLLRFQSKE